MGVSFSRLLPNNHIRYIFGCSYLILGHNVVDLACKSESSYIQNEVCQDYDGLAGAVRWSRTFGIQQVEKRRFLSRVLLWGLMMGRIPVAAIFGCSYLILGHNVRLPVDLAL